MTLELWGVTTVALACLQQALALQPDYAPTWFTLATVLKDCGDFPGALECFRKAIALQPDFAEAHAALLFTRYNLDPEHIRADAEAFGRILGAGATPFQSWNCPPPEPLRVAIVSADLRDHAVARFLLTTLPALASLGVQLFAFSNWPEQDEDAITTRLRSCFSQWHNIFGLSDAEAARCIHNAAVHICLDLSGHTNGNRLGVFAWRPAPVLAVWCGYATTGLAAMDAFIADADTLPPEAEAHFCEPVRRLPVRLCYSAPEFPGLEAHAPVSPLLALHNGYVTFGCFQQIDKIRPHTLALWAELLRQLPSARLRVQCNGLHLDSVREAFTTRLHMHGLDPARIDLHGFLSRETYLHAYDSRPLKTDFIPP